MTRDYRMVYGERVEGDNLDERAARLRKIRRNQLRRRAAAIARGEDPEQAEERWEEEHETPLHLPGCDACTVGGIYYSSRAKADAVCAALHAAGFDDIAVAHPDAQRALRQAGLL